MGLSNLLSLANRFDVEFKHSRSMALNYDVVNISQLNGRDVQSLISQLQATNEVEHVMLNHMMYPQTFDDPLYEQQNYFQPKSTNNPQGISLNIQR